MSLGGGGGGSGGGNSHTLSAQKSASQSNRYIYKILFQHTKEADNYPLIKNTYRPLTGGDFFSSKAAIIISYRDWLQ